MARFRPATGHPDQRRRTRLLIIIQETRCSPTFLTGYAHANPVAGPFDTNRGALANYDAAIERLEKTDGIARQPVGSAYWDRGQTRMKLGQGEQGCADCNWAIKMGFKMWISLGGRPPDESRAATRRSRTSTGARSLEPLLPLRVASAMTDLRLKPGQMGAIGTGA